ncbi:MAG: T9SS C-terminal target domain-containing protein [Calditrichaeota bacterium]|nr:MAG: T9SS C-terminal target domain-containing protein [Calditrichota bacterium]
MQTFTKTLIPTLALSFGIFTSCFAQTEHKIVANDDAASDFFGYSVSIDGDYAIVGAYQDDDGGNSSGSAYIFHKSGTSWTQQAKITANDAAADDKFGLSVSISGDYAVVGANGDDDGGSSSGSSYVFKRSGASWSQEAKLTANDAAAGDNFSSSVSIDGDYVVVGANGDDDGGGGSGAAYIFHRSGTSWSQQAKLTASDAAAGDIFGRSVSINGDYTVIGADRNDDAGSNSGSAYIFHRSGTSWTQQAKLTASDAAESDFFGHSVSISGDYAVIGADHDDDGGNASGSAYIFHRSGTSWTQQDKLTASDAGGLDFFGKSVSIDGDYTVIGAYMDNDGEADSGSAYVFSRSGTSWIQQAKLTASDAGASDKFGISVSIRGNNTIAGAYFDDDGGTDSGSAYVYDTTNSGNLVSNAGCEDALVGGEIPNWTEISGTNWTQRNSNPSAQEGSDYFYAGATTGTAELQQDIDVSSHSISIDAGEATFVWSSFVADFNGSDESKIILEYRDATNTTVLDTYDSGFLHPGQTWTQVTDTRLAPVGTRTVRIRMQSRKDAGGNSDGYHDNLSLLTFATSDADQPLAVELDSFTARQIENSIQLSWTTASETENEGFNVYRKISDSNFIQIASYKRNSELVGALNSTFSNNYTFVDDSELRSGETYTYYISDVETNGLETKHEDNSQSVKFILDGEVTQTKLDYELAQNFPNPFNPSTTINFQIKKDQRVKLQVYNLNGQLVKELVNEKMNKGSHSVNWNGTDQNGNQVSSGTYFYKISAGTFTQTNKMILLK